MTAPHFRADWDTYPTAPLTPDALALVAVWRQWLREGGSRA